MCSPPTTDHTPESLQPVSKISCFRASRIPLTCLYSQANSGNYRKTTNKTNKKTKTQTDTKQKLQNTNNKTQLFIDCPFVFVCLCVWFFWLLNCLVAVFVVVVFCVFVVLGFWYTFIAFDVLLKDPKNESEE